MGGIAGRTAAAAAMLGAMQNTMQDLSGCHAQWAAKKHVMAAGPSAPLLTGQLCWAEHFGSGPACSRAAPVSGRQGASWGPGGSSV